MYQGKLGVGIISFNRSQYLSRLLNSLSQNTHLENTDFHLYQDGAKDRFSEKSVANLSDIQLCVRLFADAKLPNQSMHIRTENVSIAINQFEAYEELTSNYEYVLILEDDVVLSPNYLRLLRILIGQFAGEDDVFSVSLNFRRGCDFNEIAERFNWVRSMHEHWWAECFSSKKWQLIRPNFLKYYELVKDINYRERPGRKIIELFESVGFSSGGTSQDAGKDMAVSLAGLKRINSLVNRGIYIGQTGMHFTPSVFQRLNFHNQEPYIFDEDKTLTEFKLG